MPVVPEGVACQIHIAVALEAPRISVSGKIHMMTLDARAFLAIPVLVFQMIEGNSKAIEIAVDPERVSTPGVMNGCGSDTAAWSRLGL